MARHYLLKRTGLGSPSCYAVLIFHDYITNKYMLITNKETDMLALETKGLITQADFVILDSVDEMIALYDLLELTNPERSFRGTIDGLISSIVEMCFFKRCAQEELDTYLETNYFVHKLPNAVIAKQWNVVIVHASGGSEVVDRRKNRRNPKEIIETLARNIWYQLSTYQLYDPHGTLMFGYDPTAPDGSIEIRLRRLR
jgi:hypothetical protein